MSEDEPHASPDQRLYPVITTNGHEGDKPLKASRPYYKYKNGPVESLSHSLITFLTSSEDQIKVTLSEHPPALISRGIIHFIPVEAGLRERQPVSLASFNRLPCLQLTDSFNRSVEASKQ
ncbi:hypothetical protein Pmani_029443 [Petrolisthes manimaculis]|uniref:Uncharacterized protein n=1 Tax=Petrolisthes manimaculis TaxID=1843537 RepID=A0AAE1TUG7_9EUCA|nr:hypothetical protein Pmani_029443 [Petrolisthes manimaculis]